MSDYLLVWAQLAINGIAVGAIYAMVAIGIVLIYKATEVLNFAHGDLLTVGAFTAWGLITVFEFSFLTAMVLTVVLVALLAFSLDTWIIRRIAGQLRAYFAFLKVLPMSCSRPLGSSRSRRLIVSENSWK
ncbi:MAG: hypothetical protein EBT78_14060, partial [Betaproteobacteria bacterium]|nr:hypothetical protein [Betaproteobacteria bacterium]